MRLRNFLLSVIAGAATGAVIGILFAPAKGKNTRKKIVDKGLGLGDELKSNLLDFINKKTDQFMSAKADVEETVDKIKTKEQHLKNDLDKIKSSKD